MDPISPSPGLPLSNLLSVLSDITRWRILAELIKGEPLPVKEIALRISAKATSVTKHCAILREAGIIQRGFGNPYKICPHLIVPGQPALDLGAVLIRLDRVK